MADEEVVIQGSSLAGTARNMTSHVLDVVFDGLGKRQAEAIVRVVRVKRPIGKIIVDALANGGQRPIIAHDSIVVVALLEADARRTAKCIDALGALVFEIGDDLP